MKPTIHKYLGEEVVIALVSLFVNIAVADDSSARLDAYKGNRLVSENFQIDINNPSSAESISFSKASMTWSAGLSDSLQSRFAGFMDLTLAEWAALEDSGDKYLFGAYVAMGKITDAKITPEEAYQDAEMVMDNALSYWQKNNTKLPSDLDISWVCCPPSEEFWKLNKENFSCAMTVGSVSASDFTDSQAKLTCSEVTGINSGNLSGVLNRENAASSSFTLEDGTTLTFSQFEALCEKVRNSSGKDFNPLTDYNSTLNEKYAGNNIFNGNFTIATSNGDNLKGVTNWAILDNRVPDSVYNQLQSASDCKGKNFSAEQWEKIKTRLSGSVASSAWDQSSGILVNGSELTNYEAGLCEMPY